MKPGLPPNEEARLEALRSYDLLDTVPEKEYEDLVLLASQICGAPIAMISLIDEHRQWFKSKVGMPLRETPREDAFCAHGILQKDVFVVEDARRDTRFSDNPLVTGSPKIRFYAGAPLVTSDGHALGMICVNDQVPREIGPKQREALQALSRQVVAQMELRRTSSELRKSIRELEQTKKDAEERTAFFEALVNSSPDGLLIVDSHGRRILQNKRIVEIWRIPKHIAEGEYKGQLQWVSQQTKDPDQFMKRVAYLYDHANGKGRDEIALKSGTILDRFSSPVIGKEGKQYGRIWSYHDVTEIKRNTESLQLLSSAVEQSKESILITDADLDQPGPKILFVNPAFTAMTGYTADEVIGKTPRILHGPLTDRAVMDELRAKLEAGEVFEGETINYKKNGEEFNLEWQIAPLRDDHNKITHFVAIQHDITERKRLEARLFQSQKMETVGKLAGGIAHEFNSILTAIIGQSELLLNDLRPDNPLGKSVREIRSAADRAATLTRQLLAYGRKQILQPEVLDLNRVLSDMLSTLQHLMGNEVDVRIIPTLGLKKIKIDPGQIEQVIVSLAMNSVDAMPNGGKLTLETSNVELDEDYVSAIPGLQAGHYVLLSISDTGIGMTDEVKARAFEPFFSTKSVGQGTGLGLATCYGIIKQSNGHINLYSEVARGATFKIYLPQVEEAKQPVTEQPDLPDLPRGTETILLAEDDPSLLEMSATFLRRLGYTVLTAVNGVDALSLKNQRDIGHIDLLLTDVVMPHMSGKELSERITMIYPRTKILFTSAYTENAIVHQGVLDEGVTLLQKPFTPTALAHKVREILDKPPVSRK